MTQTATSPAATSRDLPLSVLAATAGLAALATAAYHLLTPGSPQATFGSVSDWTRDLLFLTYLLAAVGTALVGRARSLVPTAAAALVGAGYGLVAAGVAAGLVLQDDPDWFFLLAGPGLVASFAGFVVWAVVGVRRRVLPVWAAVWLVVGGLFAVVGGEAGLSAIIGSFWIWYVAGHRRGA